MAVSPPSRLPGLRNTTRPTSMYEDPSDPSSKQAKRRSLLPTFARKFSEDKSSAGTNANEDKAEDNGTVPDAADEARKAMPPPALARPNSVRLTGGSLLSRSSSLRTTGLPSARDRKASLSSAATTSLPGSRLRTASVTSTSSANETAGPRPPSSGLSRTDSKRGPPSPGKRSLPAPKSAHTRTTSVAKPGGASTSQNDTPAQRSPPNSSLARPSSSRSQLPPPSRPAFNTYQQHYSPAKSALPKAPIPAASHTKRPSESSDAETNTVLDQATINLQISLLQLSLLHREALTTTDDWTASAKNALSRRHKTLSAQLETLLMTEQDRRILSNLADLENWVNADPALLATHLHTLASVVAELTALTEPGSRWETLVSDFVIWAERAERLHLNTTALSSITTTTPPTPTTSSNPSTSSNLDSTINIEPLPESWRATHTSLALKLRSLHRDIELLPPAPPHEPLPSQHPAHPTLHTQTASSTPTDSPTLSLPPQPLHHHNDEEDQPSSLEITLDSCVVLVKGMLKELEIMTRLQKEILARERARLDERVRNLCALEEAMGEESGGGGGAEEKAKGWVPAWTAGGS